MRSPNPRPNLTYDYKGYKPHPNGWAVSREKMEQLDSEGRLHFPKAMDGRIQLKRYLDEMSGVPLSDIWSDLAPIHAHDAERLGYPTQKPVALLERILKASSNEGDVVLDPFCGCGTTIAAAQNLGRQWIGIDVTHLAVGLQKFRLKETFGMVPIGKSTTESTENTEKDISKTSVSSVPSVVKNAYKVIGQPEDLEGAKNLAENDRYGFQWWIHRVIYEQERRGCVKEYEQMFNYVGGSSSGGGKGRRFNVRSGIAGKAIREQAVLSASRNNSDYEAYIMDLISSWGFTETDARGLSSSRNSWMAVPIKYKGDEVTGVLYLDSDDVSFFDDENVKATIVWAAAGLAVFIDARY